MGRSRTVTVSVIETRTEVTIGLDRDSGFPGVVKMYGSLFVAGTINLIRYKTIELWVNGVKGPTTSTGSEGRYHFDYTVGVGTYDFYARFPGDGLYLADNSPTVTGTYAKVATDITIDVNPLAGGGPLAITILGRLSRTDTALGLGGKTVKLYRNKNGGSFTMIKSMTTKTSAPLGIYEFHDSLTVLGDYGYYVEFAGDAHFEGCEAGDGSTVIDGVPPDEVPVGYGPILLLALLVMTQE